MWKVLGVDTVLVSAGEVWHDRLIELSKRKKDRDKFLELLEKGEVRYIFDTQRETHVFLIILPSDVSQEEMQFMGSFITKLHKGAKAPLMEYEGASQKSTVILTSEEEADDYEQRRKRREAERVAQQAEN